NVFEWCLDFFDTYRGKSRTNPRGPQNGSKRVYRGGSWKSRGGSLRASARAFNDPDYSSNDVGFRIVCECG
ncbi:MAG: formylglycine-generating enzyme family protein, partial [Chthoniobacteraceae bacterium]